MLKKQYRLKNRLAFSATYKQRNTISNEFMVAYLGREKKDAGMSTKVGFVVSKKFHKRAVKRNRTKRVIREVYRLALKSNEINEFQRYQSVIFIPKNKALGADFKTIQNSLHSLCKKLS